MLALTAPDSTSRSPIALTAVPAPQSFTLYTLYLDQRHPLRRPRPGSLHPPPSRRPLIFLCQSTSASDQQPPHAAPAVQDRLPLPHRRLAARRGSSVHTTLPLAVASPHSTRGSPQPPPRSHLALRGPRACRARRRGAFPERRVHACEAECSLRWMGVRATSASLGRSWRGVARCGGARGGQANGSGARAGLDILSEPCACAGAPVLRRRPRSCGGGGRSPARGRPALRGGRGRGTWGRLEVPAA